MLKATFHGTEFELKGIKRYLEKEYVIVTCKEELEDNILYLELELPKTNSLERDRYELDIPAESRRFLDELDREDIQFQIEEEERRILLSFHLLHKKRVAELYKAYCISCGMDQDILHKCSIFIDANAKDSFESMLKEKGIEHHFVPKGNGFMLELSKMDIPMFERIRSGFGSKILLKPIEKTYGRHMSSHRQRGCRTR